MRGFLRWACVVAFTICGGQAFAQGSVLQAGPVVPGHLVEWLQNGIVGDGGSGNTTGPITPTQITVSNSGLGYCQNGPTGVPQICMGFSGNTPIISTPQTTLALSIGGTIYNLPAAFNTGGGGGGGGPVTAPSVTVNNQGLGICQNGATSALCSGFVGNVPTISTAASTLNISIGGTVYALPAAFNTGGGGGGGGSGTCPTCLPLAGGTMTGLLVMGVGGQLLDNQFLYFSTDKTRFLQFQTSPNAIVADGAPFQSNQGFQMPAGMNLVFNSAVGTAFVGYDAGLSKVRFQNVPVQFDQTVNVSGGSMLVAGSVIAGSGFAVNGTYTGFTSPALDFTAGTFATGAPAIRVGDNNTISLSTAQSGFAMKAVPGTPDAINFTYNSATVASLDSSGNLTISGRLSASSGFSALQTFSGGISVPGPSSFSGAVTLSGPNLSVNGAVATVLGSLGPTGSHTTVQEWITVIGSGGATRYIPAF